MFGFLRAEYWAAACLASDSAISSGTFSSRRSVTQSSSPLSVVRYQSDEQKALASVTGTAGHPQTGCGEEAVLETPAILLQGQGQGRQEVPKRLPT